MSDEGQDHKVVTVPERYDVVVSNHCSPTIGGGVLVSPSVVKVLCSPGLAKLLRDGRSRATPIAM